MTNIFVYLRGLLLRGAEGEERKGKKGRGMGGEWKVFAVPTSSCFLCAYLWAPFEPIG